jgi:hypothetical protein
VAALAGLAPDEPEPDEPEPEDDEPEDDEPEDDEPEDDEPAAAGAGVPVEAGVDESDLLSEPAAAAFSALTLPARESLR